MSSVIVAIFALYICTLLSSVQTQCLAVPPNIQSRIQTNGTIKLHYLFREGSGDSFVIFLHGWPQDAYEWIEMMEIMPPEFNLIAPDNRGIGLSEFASTGYDKATMAKDVLRLMDSLGIQKAHFITHDIGAQIGYAFAAQFPDRTLSFTLMDVPIPGTPIFKSFNMMTLFWHFAFNAAPAGIPETLTTGQESYYYGTLFLRNYEGFPGALSDAQVTHPIQVYTDPQTATAGFNLYRAFDQDSKDNEEFFKDKLQMPVLALNAGRLFPEPYAVEMMTPLAVNVTGKAIDSGHWIPEEKPQEVVDLFLKLIG